MTLTHSSGWGSTFNRNCVLACVLPAVGTDLESPGSCCCRAKRRLRKARFALGAEARAASRRINPRSWVLPGPGCRVTVLARDGSKSPARAALRLAELKEPGVHGCSLGHPGFWGLLGFGASGVTSNLLAESGNDQKKRKRKYKLNKDWNEKSRQCAGWSEMLNNAK